ncbi:hypothetical protein BKA65DRAFT_523073 [Rhexocercosporidium sp. MPI-PUGE-AT-0058]|nr:hypothetical protein BKA65DRAFT_523073 [Rhexocercosporidium sp. MPI-PUGE-AT-0058]
MPSPKRAPRRFFVLVTLRLLSPFLPRHGPVLMLSKTFCIKLGTLKQPAEAATMQFVAKHTSISIPRVYCAFERKGCKYMLMERMQGHILRNGWLERSAESKEKILAQIKTMTDQMRRILCGSLFDSYEGGNEKAPEANRLVEWHNRYCGKPVFTHGDLNTMNIMVQGDDVYWEYTSAWHVNPYDEFWREDVDKFLEPHLEELDMERVRRRFFGDF